MIQPPDIARTVLEAASKAGFELAGIAGVDHAKELEYFPQWIAEGRAGEMKYLEARDEQGRLKRASIANAAPWARSVIVCAVNYNTAQPYSTKPADPTKGWVSRYAWSREDYHEAVLRRLRQVEAALQAACDNHISAQSGSAGPLHNDSTEDLVVTHCYVDTGPLVERVVAKYAGIGWIGKNTCIINQKLGSWLFLGVILTSLELASQSAPLPAPDRCGSCTRCIDACPTGAFLAPYQLDSTKCISYLTIEKRGEVDNDLRLGMGRHVFGCDICQDVCPWNRKAAVTSAAEFQPRLELVNPALEWIAEMSEEEFRTTFRRSPVRRAKREGLRRNAIIAIANSGERKFVSVLEKLINDEDEIVRKCATWALRKLTQLVTSSNGELKSPSGGR